MKVISIHVELVFLLIIVRVAVMKLNLATRRLNIIL